MRVIFAFHPIMDLGGIIPFTEDLGYGFRKLGHDVELACLGRPSISRTLQYEEGKLGVPVHFSKGWMFKNIFTEYRPWKKFTSGADLIIWITAIPTKSRKTKNQNSWVQFYDLNVPQIVVLHDCNACDFYPWLYQILPSITALASVHYASAGTAKEFPVPFELIPNPHDLSNLSVPLYKRENSFLSLQNFKTCKRVDGIIRAIPYMDVEKHMGGYGIEQRYMVSKDKIKPKYICSKALDPDLPDEDVGLSIWDRALEYGMIWHGPQTPAQRDWLLQRTRCLIDNSYTKRSSRLGGVFNRTMIEAMKFGTVPICTALGISGNVNGDNLFFKPYENFLPLDLGWTPKEYGAVISEFCRKDHRQIIDSNLELIQQFEASKIAETYIDLATYPFLYMHGRENTVLRKKSNEAMLEHFGVAP